MIMRHVLEELSKESLPPATLTLNMRELPFVDVETFINNFKKKLCGWYETLFNVCRDVCSFESKYFGMKWKQTAPSLVDLLEGMSKALPDWTWFRGYQIPVPILFIDEANLLRELVINNPDGQKILKTIFMWFVSMTKEQEKFHVMLCSSDSFIYSWLANFVGNDRFNTYAIGHLPKQDAKKYWDEMVAIGGFHNKKKLHFNEIFEICGGNIYLMKRMYCDYIFGDIHPKQSFFIQQARSRLLKALLPSNPFTRDPLKSPPKWKREDVITVIERLANSHGGYVYFDELCKVVEQVSLESLIEYNIIHLRPYFGLCCQDLDPVPARPDAVITPESQVGLLAMKQMLKTIKEDK